MYAMGGLMTVAVIAHALVQPVKQAIPIIIEAKGVDVKDTASVEIESKSAEANKEVLEDRRVK